MHYLGMSESAIQRSGLDAAIHAAGGKAALAKALGNTKSAISNWARRGGEIPAAALPRVVKATGLPAHVLRPDLFDASPHSTPARQAGS